MRRISSGNKRLIVSMKVSPGESYYILSPMQQENRGVHLISLGCSKNTVDSENLLGEFARAGYHHVPGGEQADVTIVNTCGFIEPAKEESIQTILDALHERRPGQKLVVAGCLSARYRDELAKEIPEADLFVGTYRPGEMLGKLGINSQEPLLSMDLPRQFLEDKPHHAYLKIAEGCNRQCGFCAIPGMRGKQDSRPLDTLVREAQFLQQRGIVELSLIAQDLTFYGREKEVGGTLTDLLRALISETDIPWIRLMYAYPAFLEDELLDFMAAEPRLCNYLDMPIQHVSDAMLKSMRRGYTRKQLAETIQRLRRGIPGLSLRTTVLVGYPGETEKDFEELMAFLGENPFERLGGFPYSEEEGTYAGDSLREKNLPKDVIEERLSRLMAQQQEIAERFNQQKVGTVQTVLLDETVDENGFQYLGRTEADAPEVDQAVWIKGEGGVPGTFRKVRIESAFEFDLEGELLPEGE